MSESKNDSASSSNSRRLSRRGFVRTVSGAAAGAGLSAAGLGALDSFPAEAAPGDASLILVANGAPRAAILTAAGASEKVQLAAADLQHYIQKMSGAVLPLASDTAPPGGTLILVGKSRLTTAMNLAVPSGLTPARRDEGFIILRRGERLVLAGNDEGPYHGTEYAVSEFLNRLGVRWFMPGEFGEIVPTQPTVSIKAMDVSEKPDFVMRNWWLHTTPELAALERRWKIHNKMNPDDLFATPGDSSARNLVSSATYFKEHPEYFALNADGTRNPNMPNLTNPKTVQIAAETIKDYFRKNPAAASYGFAPDDGMPRDFSPDTLKENKGFIELGGRPGVPEDASISEEWFTFVNNVTAEVRKEFPDHYIATNGYANRDIPPQGIRLDDHLVVMFAAIWSCTLHAYNDSHCWQKVRQGQMLQEWCKLSKNVWIYGYNYEMLVSALTPLPEVRKLRRDFPLMKQWGVMGFDDETRNTWAEAGILSHYVRALLEWNAASDVDAISRDFYTRWYGAAAEPARAFYDAIETAIETTPLHGHEDRMLPWVYTPELMASLPAHIEQAERLADTDRTRLHVHADRLIFEHLQGYVAMSAAEAAADFAGAAGHASHMLDLRKQLNAINPFFIWPNEERYDSGIWYWGLNERRDFYQSLADKISGKTGELIAMLPERALARIDPQDDGRFAGWNQPGASDAGWKPIQVTRPFYAQGYEDEEGHPYVGILWYRFNVEIPAAAAGKKVMLYIPVVETEGWCWVNGQYVGHRPYQEAYIRPNQMEADVTAALRPGATNQIAIRVSTPLAAAQAASGILSRSFLYAPRV